MKQPSSLFGREQCLCFVKNDIQWSHTAALCAAIVQHIFLVLDCKLRTVDGFVVRRSTLSCVYDLTHNNFPLLIASSGFVVMFKKSFLKIVLNKRQARGLWGFMISDTDRPKRSVDEKKIVGKSCRCGWLLLEAKNSTLLNCCLS